MESPGSTNFRQATPADTDITPDRDPRVAWRAFFVGAAVLVATVVAFVIFRHWPPLTAEEKVHLGTWYGYIDEGHRHYNWIIELRRDKTCRVSFRHFERLDGASSGKVALVAGEIEESVGTWALDGSAYTTTTRYPARERSWWERVRTWLSVRYWPPGSTRTYKYLVRQSSPTEFIYHLPSGGVTFHAVRVRDGFQLPDFPLPPPEAPEWWNTQMMKAPAAAASPD